MNRGDLPREEDSRGERKVSLEPSRMSELDDDDKLNLDEQVCVGDAGNTISGELEGAQGLNSELVEGSEEEMKLALKENADAEPEKLISGKVDVDKASDGCELTPEALQELIMERKAERKRKAEEKRLEGLRQIAEMKSRDEIHPVDVFPEEIWIKILEDPDLDPQDRYNMCLAHPFFNALMEDSKIQDILFPLALDYTIRLLKRVFDLNHRTYESINKRKFKMQILILRLVSKNVRDVVDKWIEDDLLYSMRKPRSEPSLSPMWLSFCSSIVVNEISAFTSNSCTPVAGRPMRFVMRSLKINYDRVSLVTGVGRMPVAAGQGEPNDIWQRCARVFTVVKDKITEFLEKFGDQIWFLDISFNPVAEAVNHLGASVSAMLSTLRQWLLLLPNLKWLKLAVDTDDEDWKGFSFEDQHFMPRLNALERVDFSVWITSQMLDAVFTANPHVKYIFQHGIDQGVDVGSPRFSRLALENATLTTKSDTADEQLFRSISESSWKLKKLTLYLDVYGSMDAVFQCLQQSVPTLEGLSMEVGLATVEKKLGFLRLSNLREFKLTVGHNHFFSGDMDFFFGLSFLLFCDKLESLSWTNRMPEYRMQNVRMSKNQSMRLINFQGEGGGNLDLSKSNIWNVFPLLKIVKLLVGDQRNHFLIYRP